MKVGMKEVRMLIKTVLPLINEYREKAWATAHPYSDSISSDPIPCSDKEVADFCLKLAEGEPTATLTISNIEWERFGNCEGDRLYPVVLKATRLPDGRYYLQLEYFDTDSWSPARREYILEL